MPLSLECPECGKKLRVPDEWAGKKVKCPGCGHTFPAAGGAAGPAMAAAPARAAGKAAAGGGGTSMGAGMFPSTSRTVKVSEPKFALSGGMIAMIVVLVCVIAGILTFIYGPMAVHKKWEAMAQQAENDVTDVTARAMEVYLSNSGVDLMKSHSLPQVREVSFYAPVMVAKMPEWVDFHGQTSQGNFKGRYNTTNGEVEENLELGGMTFAGVDKPIIKSSSSVHVTGRKKDGNVTVELDGKRMEVVYPKHGKDD